MKEEVIIKIKNFKAALLSQMNKHKILTVILCLMILPYINDFAANFYNSVFVGDCAMYGKYYYNLDIIKAKTHKLVWPYYDVYLKLNSICPVLDENDNEPRRRFLGRMNDGRFVFYTIQQDNKKQGGAKLLIELYNPLNNSLVRLPLEYKMQAGSEFIWLGDNKFIAIYNIFKNTVIYTYKINDDRNIEKIAETKEKNYGYYGRSADFNMYRHLVLNSETVIFLSTGVKSLPFKRTKHIYLYNYKINKFLRLEDYPHKNWDVRLLKLDDYSFLVYPNEMTMGDRNIYIYFVNRKVAKVDQKIK